MDKDNKSTTFWKLICDNGVDKIDIPRIQRDYAQGRSEESERREKFLEAILKCLRESAPLHLDFIYGKIEEKTFYPIDGQQRLTTLFLLHWYFGVIDGKFGELEILKKFSYDTRPSSRDFCIALVDNAKEISTVFENKKEWEESVPALIKDFSWFKYGWEDDPTISSMLVMIESIHKKFEDIRIYGWSKLVDKELITFEILDLGKEGFELPDELYIKMNARGKQLTSFENFKAEFIDFLGKEYGEQKVWSYEISGEKRKLSYNEYFSYKIEKEWCDLFWAYRNESSLSTRQSPIDNEIMNFIYVIAQLCYFKDNKDKEAKDFKRNLEIIKDVFAEKDNVDFLFFILDCLYDNSLDNKKVSKNKLENFFATLFFVNENQNDEYAPVNISWNSKSELLSESLFSQCLIKGLDLGPRNKILFYCMFSFIRDNHNRLNYYLRVIRNLLYAQRQRNETKYNPNVRINYFGKYWKLFEQLQVDDVYNLLSNDNFVLDNKETDISDESLEYEKQKAKLLNEENRKSLFALEDQSFLCGYLRNFDLENNADRINEYAMVVPEIFSCKNTSLVIRAMIASDFEGIYIRKCALGYNYYFGTDWETVLTYTGKDEKLNDSLVKFLNHYISRKENSVETKLQGIIDDWLKKNATNRTWKYYFIKYENFTDNKLKEKDYYYCWKDKSDDIFQIEMLGSESSNPLLAYHINPFIYTAIELTNSSEIREKGKGYARYSDESFLYVEKIKRCFNCRNDGWEINDLSGIAKDILKKYNIDENEKLLKPNEGMDMIEVAVAFLKDLYK